MMTPQQLSELGIIVDRACDIGDEEELCAIIATLSEYPETLNDSIIKATLYYFLANAWSGLRDIRQKKDILSIWKYEQNEVFKEIYYFRKALSQLNFNELELPIQLGAYVNLANAFSHYGRTINAIKYYNKALFLNCINENVILHPNYILGVLNKAKALEYYAGLDYDPNHKFIFIQYAYKAFKEARGLLNSYLKQNSHDKEYYEFIEHTVKKNINDYEEQWSVNDLENFASFENYELNHSKNEQIYRDWCLQNRLFLNPINDLGNYKIASYDPLNLPNLTTAINEGFPKFITYFNQMKQEYISYRHILFEGLNKKTQKFYYKETSITDDYDYNLYDINTEKTKLAFRGFYSIFDKIAYFMNEYFQIGLRENNVDFKKIWYDYEEDRRTVKEVKPIFNKSENLALRGIYLISKDLFFSDKNSEEFLNALEPEAEKLNNIRNHLEHKFISIKLLDIKAFEKKADRKRSFYILEDDLEVKTLHLAQLAREAMIYLSFAVHIEENKKDSDELYLPIFMNTLNDNRK